MNAMQTRIATLEAQINAMAQAWLYLAAHVEIECGLDMRAMETAMKDKRWPNNPDLDPEARSAVRWLCSELDQARTVRNGKKRRAARKH